MGRRICGTAMTFFLALPWLAGSALAEAVRVRIVLFGDSYISSHNVDPKLAFGVKLEAALNANGPLVHVTSTDYTATAARGVARLESFLATESILGGIGPKVVILELGSNDCFRFKLEETQANLDAILQVLADQHIPVLVAGTTPYTSCEHRAGANYNALYVQMFADLATKYGDLYYRDFKDGVGDHPELMQDDRDHPTAEGDAVIVARILPVVEMLVARAKLP
jgi:acyl-CoA thioesterase I